MSSCLDWKGEGNRNRFIIYRENWILEDIFKERPLYTITFLGSSKNVLIGDWIYFFKTGNIKNSPTGVKGEFVEKIAELSMYIF